MSIRAFLILSFFTFGESKMLILIDDSYKDCSKGPIKFLDWSGIEFVYENDTTYFLNGNAHILRLIFNLVQCFSNFSWRGGVNFFNLSNIQR